MLKVMRQSFSHLKWILWFVVFVFIAFIFVSWGKGGTGGPSVADIAQVGSEAISPVDFNRQFQQTQERYRQLYKQSWTPALVRALDLPHQVVNGMIDHKLELEAARQAGLSVSDDELAQKIQSMSGFRRNGAFIGASEYASVLAANGYTVELFEREFREELLLEKLNRLLASSMIVSDAMVQEQFSKQNEKAKIDYVLVPSDKFGTAAAPTDAELLAYFNQNKERFRQPERRKIKYLLVDDVRLREQFKPAPAEIAAYYSAHADEFPSPERVHAQHILIKVASDATPAADAAARKKAEDVAARARKGEDFAQLAKQYSEDASNKDRGGDLGFFARGAMVKPFEEAAFAMSPGEIRGPVKTSFGYHVIKLIEKQPAGRLSLAETTPRIGSQLSSESVRVAGARRAEAIEKMLSNHPTDEAMRKAADDVVVFDSSDWIQASGAIRGIGYAPELLKAVFALKEGEATLPAISTSRGPVIAKVAEIRAPGLPDFAEVKAKVAADYRQHRQDDLAIAGARPIAAELAAGASLEDIGKRFNLTVQTPPEFNRGGSITGLNASEELEKAIFATDVGKTGGPVAVANRGVALFKVDSKTGFDPASFALQKEKIRQSICQSEADRLLQAMVQRARTAAKVTVNEDALKKFQTQG